MFSSGNKTVDLVGQMNIEGNVIPFNWYSAITFENGKPDLNAIIILSDIANIKEFNNLFLTSYKYFSLNFGLSERQVKQAIDRLIKIGVIERVFKDNGKQRNAMYIGINKTVFNKITFKV